MSESLWADMDAWLLTQFDADLGTASTLYTDLLIQTLDTYMFRDVSEWDTEVDPALSLCGWDVIRRPGPHGDGSIHHDKGFNYLVYVRKNGPASGINSNSADRATIAEVKRMQARVERSINSMTIPGTLVSDFGERPQDLKLGNSHMGAYRHRGTGGFVVWSQTQFIVETQT